MLCTAKIKKNVGSAWFQHSARCASKWQRPGWGRFHDHASDGLVASQNLYFFFQTWCQKLWENAGNAKKKKATPSRLVKKKKRPQVAWWKKKQKATPSRLVKKTKSDPKSPGEKHKKWPKVAWWKTQKATRSRLVYRDDVEGNWASRCRHSEDRRVSHGLGWPANPMFFYNRIHEKQFFTLPVVNDNEIVRNTSDVVEGKSGLICLVCYIQSCWCRRVLQFLVTLDNGWK